ncbi:MAG: dihydrolipoyl dehydrogenase [Steroidobacteraceae bacterium]
MTSSLTTDVLVIGAGTAGLNAIREIEAAGKRWLLVENGPYGTTCARVGCMPSKLLIAAADRAHAVATATDFGITVTGSSIDVPAVFARVRTERDRFVAGAVAATEKLDPERRLSGTARFMSPTRVIVEDPESGTARQIDAQAVVIATGSSANVPAPFDSVADAILTSDQVFELTALPASLAVIGTGVIGLELGQALARLGVAVTFFSNGSRIGPLRDPAVQAAVRNSFTQRHSFHLNARITAVEQSGDSFTIEWHTKAGEQRRESFAQVLLATGRRPQLAALNLAATGLELDERGHPPWHPLTTQCGDAPIFLAGDASGHRAILHEAADEGRIAGQNAVLFPQVREHERRAPLAIVFTHPQMASAGCALGDLDESGVAIGEVSFEKQGRARVLNRNEGVLRLYADRSCARLVGAELFGPDVEHLAHLLAWAVQRHMTVPEMLRLPFYHPVIEESVRTGLRRLAKQLQVEFDCEREDFALAPGL